MLHNTSAMRGEPILLYGEDSPELAKFKRLLENEGFTNITVEPDTDKATALLQQRQFSLSISSHKEIGQSDWEKLSRLKTHYPNLPVIFVTGQSNTESIVEVMRRGAYDIFNKPLDEQRFLVTVVRALERKILMDALSNATGGSPDNQLRHPEAFAHIVTRDPTMNNIFRYLEAIADSSHPILISGETGTGKELIARAIYILTGRESFITVNIAGVDDAVFSDTLFGHTKGAFTGADAARDGLLVKANDGVLFLDEIGDLADISQIKLLRLIQEGTYYQLGSDTPREVNARLILATNKNLETLVEKGTFRKDLFYRIRTHNIHLPPLRERLNDIPILVPYFASKAALAMNKKPPHIVPELLSLLKCYNYPGNVRELESMINDAVARHKRGALAMSTFQEKVNSGSTNKPPLSDLSRLSVSEVFTHFPTLKEWEDYLVNLALEKAAGNQGIAAGLLGISRQALNKRILNKTRAHKPV